MKALVRCFLIGISIFVLVIIFSQIQEFNVRQDELTSIATTAMTQTQTMLQEQIEDKQHGSDNKRYSITNNAEYTAEFAHNLFALKTTNSIYHITVYDVDYKKGLLDVGITSKFRMWNGQIKTFHIRKSSIIENFEKQE